MPDREQRVTPLELFFDLVFVFGLTQVTSLMADDPTWPGLGRGLLVLAAIWWAWTGYAWLTNTLEPEAAAVRVAMVAAMAAMLVVALAIPGAFAEDGVLFAVAYLFVRLLFLLLYALAGKRDPDLFGAVVRVAPAGLVAPALLIVAGFLGGDVRVGLWIAALAIDYGWAFLGRGAGWRVSPAHFAERYGLIVIIALGESVVAIGVGVMGVELTVGVVTAAALAVVSLAALWWAYFDVYAVMGQRELTSATGAARVRFARDHYSYLHLPMVAGVVLFALGLKKTMEHVDEPLDVVPAAALCGGVALYFFAHVLMRIRSVALIRRASPDHPGWFGLGRPTATAASLILVPVAVEVASLTALALVTAVCVLLIVYDVVHYREERAQVREARP